jgi:hypothetical protein
MTAGPENREHEEKHHRETFTDAAKRGAHEMDKVNKDVEKGLKKLDKEAEEGADVVDDLLDRD